MSLPVPARRLVLAAMLALAPGPASALVAESQFLLPVEAKDRKGTLVRQAIPVTVFRDPARTRVPFLILNHGRAATAAERAGTGRYRFSANAGYFVSLGYAVFVPTRIGYLSAGGPDVEDSGACATKVYPPAYEAGTVQTLQLIDHVKTLHYVDPRRGLVVGQSFGGSIAVAVAARNVPGIVATVNFAGGAGGRPSTHPGDPCRPDLFGRLIGTWGATARIPTLWLYSENDQYMGAEHPRAWFRIFRERGGRGEFVQLPAHGKDGHSSFTANPAAWRPAFEAFLKGL